MEMGMGFLIGILGGALASIIVAVIVFASRRALAGRASSATATLPAPPPPPSVVLERRKTAAVMPGRNTVVIGDPEVRERQMDRNVQEVRELLLRLADVIGSTENASGEAARVFKSAKDAVSELESGEPGDLVEAQRILVREIDRVLVSNAKLHSELDKANTGIAEQRRQIEELRVQARIDSLTGVPNRAAFDERLSEYIALLERTNLVFSLLFLDIDHFKRVNDVHGHVNGDRILRGVAKRITASIRGNDFAARYGGEEFAVIFPGTALADALGVAERIREDVGKTNFRMDGEVVKMTVSGGLAECARGMQPTDIVAGADAYLYRAKEEGRNRIVAEGGKQQAQLTADNAR